MSDAAPPPWVRKLPEQASQQIIHLAHAEIERRRNELAWAHGGHANLLAGQMALSQAYQFIEHLVSKLGDAEGRIQELEREANAAWDVDAS